MQDNAICAEADRKELEERRLSSHRWSSHMQKKRQYSYHVQEVGPGCDAFNNSGAVSVRVWLGADVGHGLVN